MRALVLGLYCTLLLLPGTRSASAQSIELERCRTFWDNRFPRYDSKKYGGKYARYYQATRRDQCVKDWTILVYMLADNNLQPYALADLFEMESPYAHANGAGSIMKTDLIVQYDGTESDDLARLHIFADKSKSIRTIKGLAPAEFEKFFKNKSISAVSTSPVIEKLPENADSPETRFSQFLTWAKKKYPAKNYMVIVWGHGEGWTASPRNPDGEINWGGIGVSNGNKLLTIPGLSGALQAFRKVDGDAADVYVSDACLMQMTEVATEIASEVSYIVGSTQIQSFRGLPYRTLIYNLNTGHYNRPPAGTRSFHDSCVVSNGSRDSNPEENLKLQACLVAGMIPDLQRSSLNGLQAGDARDAEFVTSNALVAASLDSSRPGGHLLAGLRALAYALEAYLLEFKDQPEMPEFKRPDNLRKKLREVLSFKGGAKDLNNFLDLVQFVVKQDLLTAQAKAGNADLGYSFRARELLGVIAGSPLNVATLLEQATLSYAYGPGYLRTQNQLEFGSAGLSKAISIWLPHSREDYEARKADFMRSKFYAYTNWQRWLDVLFREENL